MLNFIFLKNKFQNFIKNNGMFDFFLKALSKLYVYNVLIYLAFFFAEKYLIEFNTRYIFNWLLLKSFNLIKYLNWSNIYIYLYMFCFNIILFII